MTNILSRNKFLILSLVLFTASLGILLFKFTQYNAELSYFGNNSLGNGFWLHPNNKMVKEVKKFESFKGVLLAMDQTQNKGYFPTSIAPYENSKIEEHFTFLMPTKIDLNNAYAFSKANPSQPPVQLTNNLASSVTVLNEIEIELQSDWNSDRYQEVVKLIVRK